MSYLKGKDIKVQGDCLVYCFIKKIEKTSDLTIHPYPKKSPNGFIKW